MNPKPVDNSPALSACIETRHIPPGWCRRAWADRLRQMADRCCEDHPDLAAQYRKWAAAVETER